MKKIALFIFVLQLPIFSYTQTAPSHLKYWGYAIVDCLFDDPHDSGNNTNYITEVDTFSNLAQMCIYSPTDNIINRVNLMNNHCVNPIVHIQSIFYEIVGTNASSGEEYGLISNHISRWNSFKTTNSSVLNKSHIGAFYISDEPFWNGLTYQDLKTVSDLIKLDYPDIPIMIIEASGALSNLQIPTTVDWIGFDNYGIFDPSSDPGFLADLALLKTKKSRINQKLFRVTSKSMGRLLN